MFKKKKVKLLNSDDDSDLETNNENNLNETIVQPKQPLKKSLFGKVKLKMKVK